MFPSQRLKTEKRAGFESEKGLGFREKSLSIFPRSRLWSILLVSLGFTICSIFWFALAGNPLHAEITASKGSNGSGTHLAVDASGHASPGASGWQRARLFPEELSIPGNVKFNYSKDGYYPTFDSLVGDVVPGKTRLLNTAEELADARSIAHGLKIWIAPISPLTLKCLKTNDKCDNTLGCWDKRLTLFLNEIMDDVTPEEADFVFIPYFQYCFHYQPGCWGAVGSRKTDPLDTLSLIYNETMNILDQRAPGRDWGGRLIVPMAHDFGGCALFYFSERALQSARYRRAPMLVDQIVVGAMGDYDTPCFQRETDIVVPAYVDHLTLNVTVIKSSDRQYLLYFGGTLKFDLRKRQIRKKIMDKKFYKHEDQQNLHFFNDRQQYSAAIDNSAFCIGPPGVVGWTGRVWEAIYAGCIPVFLSENTEFPWEDAFDYRKFAIMLDYHYANKLETVLGAVPLEERDRLQAEGQRIKNNFLYNPPFNQPDSPFANLFRILRKKKEKFVRR
uniref:Exostosin GT47 domain-containing protein n=2 Tax=Rhodosorus marinus TaxID=101924 RepID=A0A7S3A4K7_9RHOD|mmetsp:Transcript_44677/g.173231  ORF Transcript_44677/g.173231 Transcript_44677/m.173231 type:complete len:502 (+) Transcript_44677:307-1812(+)|eukprot:CAMPEP_0113965908 /NCGR_PEP_ID=MMETSP0011_2-20120614/8023_1 /TAXON_ID=101924 /ORGANISM="Rhodosorus marinus" /LENGTH=501 /DNA_ID=CAMNT_0000978507 /DNA_START=265 /DNA_END=1770 /DNA_ORIENTATION=+ /assembly_acc=CAM_ASM_000156